MSEQQQRDARLFLETLFARQPADTVIAVGEVRKPRFARTPDDALYYVVGKRDVYARFTLLAGRPANGRGTAADSAAIPAVWAEFDVNGGPRSSGTLVADGAESVDEAVKAAHVVLDPTIVVRSGYGVHAYWCLEDPWTLADERERRAAAELVEGWQNRLRREIGFGLDSTHDLARVLRVPGSLNGKREQPAPVVLVSNAGPRYSLEDIGQHTVRPQYRTRPIDASTGASRGVGDLLEHHPKLAKIARREGNAPGDGTGHAWDYYLACEAVRSGLSDNEIGLLIRHARRGDPKSEREDYLERTIGKARADATETDTPADPAARISSRWGLADPIVSGSSLGDIASGDAIIYLQQQSGKRLRFPSLGDLFEPRKHTRIVSLTTRSRFAPLTNAETTEIAQLIVQLCGGEDLDPHEEAHMWVTEFVAIIGGTVDAHGPDGTAKGRWELLDEYVSVEEALEMRRDIARRAVIIRKDDELWLPAARLKEASGARISWWQFDNRLLEIGWRKENLDVRQPASRPERADGSKAGRIHRSFYVGEDR